MKEILFFLLCLLLFFGIVLAILFHKSISNFRKIIKQAADAREARRMAQEDEYFKRTSNKYYREDDTPNFKEGYFKGTEHETARRKQAQQQQQNTTARQHEVNTDSGVTIIDDRNIKNGGRKIFNDNEGEYVEFEEVSS